MGSLSFDSKHFFAETDESLLIYLIGDACRIDLFPLKLIIGESFECFLASFAVDEAFPFEVEECEDVGDLLLVEDAGLEA